MAELADAQDLKSCDLIIVWVQVPPRVLRFFASETLGDTSFGTIHTGLLDSVTLQVERHAADITLSNFWPMQFAQQDSGRKAFGCGSEIRLGRFAEASCRIELQISQQSILDLKTVLKPEEYPFSTRK